MPTRKWSVSKRVTQAHINMINFNWSKVTIEKPKPNTTEDEKMDKWVQQLTLAEPQEKGKEKSKKIVVQLEESYVINQLKKNQAQISIWGLLVSSKSPLGRLSQTHRWGHNSDWSYSRAVNRNN